MHILCFLIKLLLLFGSVSGVSFMLFDELYRFLGEIETDNFTASNNENTTFGFSLFGTTFFSSII